jgi:hypothetical protein
MPKVLIFAIYTIKELQSYAVLLLLMKQQRPEETPEGLNLVLGGRKSEF